jgi:hypothetical protein
VADRGSGLERRSSLQLQQQQPGQSNSAAAAAAAGGAAGSAAAAAGAADVSLQETDMIDYKLGMQVLKLRWEVRHSSNSSHHENSGMHISSRGSNHVCTMFSAAARIFCLLTASCHAAR